MPNFNFTSPALAVTRFQENVPSRPYCQNYAFGPAIGHMVSPEIRTKAGAFRLPFLQLNHPHMYRYLGVYCHPIHKEAVHYARGEYNLALVWSKAGLPTPTIITVTHDGMSAQFLWELESPVTTSAKARLGPINYASRVVEVIAQAIAGKPLGPGRRTLALNPLYAGFTSVWQDRRYCLDELCTFTHGRPGKPRLRFPQLIRTPSRQRRRALFNVVRIVAYRIVRRYSDEQTLSEALRAVASEANLWFRLPLNDRVVERIASLIARWVWKHRAILDSYTTSKGIQRSKNRGAAALGSLPISLTRRGRKKAVAERKRMGALYTAAKKRETTANGIEAAVKLLGERGEKPTAEAIAQIAHVSQRTVHRHRSQVRMTSSHPPAERPVIGDKRAQVPEQLNPEPG